MLNLIIGLDSMRASITSISRHHLFPERNKIFQSTEESQHGGHNFIPLTAQFSATNQIVFSKMAREKRLWKLGVYDIAWYCVEIVIVLR